MKCPRCQHENPPQAKFCLECGVRLALTCHKCRCDLPVGAKFCLECGEPVASRARTESRFESPDIGLPCPKNTAGRMSAMVAAPPRF